MKEIYSPMHPTLITTTAPQTTIDHVATGLSAKAYRQSLHVSQGAVARELGITQPAVAMWEDGRNWSAVKLVRYCAAVDKAKGKVKL